MHTCRPSIAPAGLLALLLLAPGAAPQLDSLYPLAEVPATFDPTGTAAADLDGDGAADLVVAGHDLVVHRGLGGARWGPAVTVATGVEASALLVVDLDGDGALDLLTSGLGIDAVSVLLGDGAGGFPARTDCPAGDGPVWLAAGDMDEDGDLDVLCANGDEDTVSLLLGDGRGSLTPTVNWGVYKGPRCIDIGDFDSDGHLDFATVNSIYPTSITVRLGDGTGLFGPKNSFLAGQYDIYGAAVFLAVRDTDGDDVDDLLVPWNGRLQTHRGLGDGTFAPPVEAPGFTSSPFVIADVNGDGTDDIVGFDLSSPSGLLSQLGQGGTTPPGQPFSVSAMRSFASANLDGDGPDDIVADSAHGVVARHGDGDGGFELQHFWAVDGSTVDFTLADLDGDGDDDAVSLQNAGAYWSHLGIALHEGTEFDAVTLYPLEPPAFPKEWVPRDLAAGDLTGDGRPEVVVALERSPPALDSVLRVFLNDGAGGFAPLPDLPLPLGNGGPFMHVDSARVDGDALADVLLTFQLNSLHRAMVLLGSGGGALLPLPSFPLAETPTSAHLVPLTTDGLVDLVVGGFLPDGTPRVEVFAGNGAGGFATTAILAPEFSVGDVVAGDVTGDGLIDLVVGGIASNITSWASYRGDGKGRFTPLAADTTLGYPQPGAGNPSALADLDGDAHLDLVASDDGRACVLRGHGDGTFDIALRHGSGFVRSPLPSSIDGDALHDLLGAASAGVNGLVHRPPSAWVDLGHALPAVAGKAPSLVALCTLQGGAPFQLSLADGKPNGSAALVVGTSPLFAPFKGGTLVPAPSLVLLGLPLDGHGHLAVAGTWYTGLPPGIAFHFQAWVADPAGPQGFTASQALAGLTP